MADLVGESLGKYKLLERLGRGGMAEVYKAHHPKLGRTVAIKILHGYLAEGEDFLGRFEREAQAVASLRHPHIVQIHDFDVDNATYYMVMEYIDGGTLQDRMADLRRTGKYMPLGQVLAILKQIAEALDYAHRKGIIHRDIKPSNILLNDSGEAFLADFGIARMVSTTQFTSTGALIGTPTYMSPEQGRGQELTAVSDIYSLGVILYELLTGKAPFAADTPLALIQKHVSEPLPPPGALRPRLPSSLEVVVGKALAKEPDMRYQSAKELVQALEKAMPTELVTELEAPAGEVKASSADRPTELIEIPVVDRASLPTVAMQEETSADILSRHSKIAESRPASTQLAPAVPVHQEATRMNWTIIVVGLGFLGSRFLIEYLAGMMNLFGLSTGLAGVEILLGIFGLCVGALLWLALRSSGVHLVRIQIITLLVIWCGSYLSVGLFTFLLNATNEFARTLCYALAGLLGGFFTGLILTKTIPKFGIKQLLVLAGSSAMFVSLANVVYNLNGQLLSHSLRMGIANGLTGLLITWTLLLLVRPEHAPVSPTAQSGKLEWSILILTFGWMLVRFLCESLGFILFREVAFTTVHPDWPIKNILVFTSTGLLSGFILWLVLCWMRIRVIKPGFFIVPLVWAGGFLVGSLPPILFRSDNMWIWTISLGLGTALSGALMVRVIKADQILFGPRKMILIGAGFGIGTALGNLILFSTVGGLAGLPQDIGYSLGASLQSGAAAMVGGSILFGLLSQREIIIKWRMILTGSIGFAIAELLEGGLFALLPQTEAVHWGVYLLYSVCGIALVLSTKNVKLYFLYGILASLGFLSGRYFWIGIITMIGSEGFITVFYTLLGLMLGIFLAVGQRVQWVLLLSLTAIFAFLLQAVIPFLNEMNILFYLLAMPKFAIVGAALGLVFGFSGMVPVKTSKKASG